MADLRKRQRRPNFTAGIIPLRAHRCRLFSETLHRIAISWLSYNGSISTMRSVFELVEAGGFFSIKGHLTSLSLDHFVENVQDFAPIARLVLSMAKEEAGDGEWVP